MSNIGKLPKHTEAVHFDQNLGDGEGGVVTLHSEWGGDNIVVLGYGGQIYLQLKVMKPSNQFY